MGDYIIISERNVNRELVTFYPIFQCGTSKTTHCLHASSLLSFLLAKERVVILISKTNPH